MMAARLLPASIKVQPNVLSREIEGETVLLDLESGAYYSLNEVGTRMWQLLLEQPELSTVCECLLAEYAIDEETLRNDLAELIERLTEAGLVSPESPAGTKEE